jgi:hypothetical protein
VEAYVERAGVIAAAARSSGVVVPPQRLKRWAVVFSADYDTVVAKHISLRESMRSRAEAAGEEIDDDTLSVMADRWLDSRKLTERVDNYLRIRHQLRQETEFDARVQGWMVDGAAVSATVSMARSRLAWLVYVDQAIAGRGGRRQAAITGAEAEVRGGDKITRLADNAGGQAFSQAEMIVQLGTVLSPVELAAVQLMFDMDTSYTESEIIDELGVDDLEQHVHGEILPKLQAKMAG